MSFINKIFDKPNKKEKKLQQGVDTIQSIIEENDSSHKAVTAAIEEIQSHPEMPVGEFMRRLQQHTDLSDADLVKIIKQLPDIRSEEATVAAVKSTDLSAPKIAEIITDAPISPNAAQKLVNEIPDEEIQKEQQAKIDQQIEEEKKQKAIETETSIFNKLCYFYDWCESFETPHLVEEIESLPINDYRTDKIDKKLLDIISKRTALDCMKFGTPRLPTLTRLISPAELLDLDLPFSVQKEYKIVKSDYDDRNKSYHEYGESEKELVRSKLLEMIAKDVATTFDEAGFFNLPQTEQLQDLTSDEINVFINTFKTYSNESDDKDISRLAQRLNGESIDELQDLNNMLEKMKPKDRELAIQKIVTILKHDSCRECQTPIQKEINQNLESIYSKIRVLPVSQQLLASRAIVNVLDERNSAINLFKKHKHTISTPNPNEKDR